MSGALLAGASTKGGVMDEMPSPQNLAGCGAATGPPGREGDPFRMVLVATAVFLALMCLLVVLQSMSFLRRMVP